MFPAVQGAEKAVSLDPTWVVARQTLGRAQLGLGEVHAVSLSVTCICKLLLLELIPQALQSFQKALHLDPLNEEVSL